MALCCKFASIEGDWANRCRLMDPFVSTRCVPATAGVFRFVSAGSMANKWRINEHYPINISSIDADFISFALCISRVYGVYHCLLSPCPTSHRSDAFAWEILSAFVCIEVFGEYWCHLGPHVRALRLCFDLFKCVFSNVPCVFTCVRLCVGMPELSCGR